MAAVAAAAAAGAAAAATAVMMVVIKLVVGGLGLRKSCALRAQLPPMRPRMPACAPSRTRWHASPCPTAGAGRAQVGGGRGVPHTGARCTQGGQQGCMHEGDAHRAGCSSLAVQGTPLLFPLISHLDWRHACWQAGGFLRALRLQRRTGALYRPRGAHAAERVHAHTLLGQGCPQTTRWCERVCLCMQLHAGAHSRRATGGELEVGRIQHAEDALAGTHTPSHSQSRNPPAGVCTYECACVCACACRCAGAA